MALVGKFLRHGHKRPRMFKGFGKTPSLPCVLAIHGPAIAGMFLLEGATPQNACELDNGCEKALAPTTNQVAPRMDFAVLWDNMFHKTISPGKCRDTTLRVNSVLAAEHNVCSAEDLCHLVMVSKGYPNAHQFEKLWRLCAKRVKEKHSLVLPRRLAIPLPPSCDPAKQAVHQFVFALVGCSGLPLHARCLLRSLVMCAPAATVKVGDILIGGPKPRSPLLAVQALRQRAASVPVMWAENRTSRL